MWQEDPGGVRGHECGPGFASPWEPVPWPGAGGTAWAERPHPPPLLQVNMAVGILVFNKLVSKDGITDKKLKERAG